MAALVGVLGSGPVNGVLLGAAISIVLLLRQASRPRVTELGRVARHDLLRRSRAASRRTSAHPACSSCGARRRCSTSTSSTSASGVFAAPRRATGRHRSWWSSFSGRFRDIDLAGAELIAELHKTLPRAASSCGWPTSHGDVRDALGRFGFDRVQGPLESGQTVHAIVSRWQSERDR